MEEVLLSRPVKKNNGRWSNPFPSGHTDFNENIRLWIEYLSHIFKPRGIASEHVLKVLHNIPVEPEKLIRGTSGLRVIWIGHATVLVQHEDYNYLIDPIWSERSGPLGMLGPKRFQPPAIALADLPRIDFICISHAHWDHLDRKTATHFGDTVKWYVGVGMKTWFDSWGVTNVQECTWWQEEDYQLESFDYSLRVCCVPAQHASRRGLNDDNKSLWCGWAIIGQNSRFYFAGDTGYCQAFSEIGEIYGPFDLAAIPIAPLKPHRLMRASHVNPMEAVQIHKDVRSKKSLAIHWGTFQMGLESMYKIPQRLAEARERHGIEPDEFATINIGEYIVGMEDVLTGYDDIERQSTSEKKLKKKKKNAAEGKGKKVQVVKQKSTTTVKTSLGKVKMPKVVKKRKTSAAIENEQEKPVRNEMKMEQERPKSPIDENKERKMAKQDQKLDADQKQREAQSRNLENKKNSTKEISERDSKDSLALEHEIEREVLEGKKSTTPTVIKNQFPNQQPEITEQPQQQPKVTPRNKKVNSPNKPRMSAELEATVNSLKDSKEREKVASLQTTTNTKPTPLAKRLGITKEELIKPMTEEEVQKKYELPQPSIHSNVHLGKSIQATETE